MKPCRNGSEIFLPTLSHQPFPYALGKPKPETPGMAKGTHPLQARARRDDDGQAEALRPSRKKKKVQCDLRTLETHDKRGTPQAHFLPDSGAITNSRAMCFSPSSTPPSTQT